MEQILKKNAPKKNAPTFTPNLIIKICNTLFSRNACFGCRNFL